MDKPAFITVVDDFVTKGNTLLGGVAEAYPGTRISVFALVRTLGRQPEIDSIILPCLGEIRNVHGDAHRVEGGAARLLPEQKGSPDEASHETALTQEAETRPDGEPGQGEKLIQGKFTQSPHRSVGEGGSTNPAVSLYFYHLDHLGTPRVITDVNGNVVSKHKYLPFGEEMSPPASTNTHEFTGHERDKETGLDYMLARYYSPAGTFRFASVDPAFKPSKNLYEPQRWNRYAYSLNNPMRYMDPDGRDAVTSVDHQNKTVKITVNVMLEGGTPQQAEKFQGDANAKWGGKKEFTAKDRSKWTMDVQVNATNDPSKFSQTDNPNTVSVSNSGQTEMTEHDQGTLNSNDLANPSTAAHEAGHMMGLTDQYNKETGQPNQGAEGSMMGDPKNPEAKPTQAEVDEVGNKAVESAKPEEEKKQ